jgi:hypothetical protein
MPRNPQTPKTPEELRSKARGFTDVALRTLVSIAGSSKAQAGARVAAASQLLDRGWGKAPASLTGADGGDIRVVIRQLIVNVEEKGDEPKVIEHDDDEDVTP